MAEVKFKIKRMHLKFIITILVTGAVSSSGLCEKSEPNIDPAFESAVFGKYHKTFQEDTTIVRGLAGPDTVNLPFGTSSRERVAGAITAIDPDEILEYNTIHDVSSAITGLVPGSLGGLNVRGLGDALVVIDGVPRPISSINIEEVDQITVLKGVNAAMLYGVQGNNGVILITTKRGIPNEKTVRVSVEQGFSKPLRLPNYLGAADYMELYNEALANDALAPLYTQEEIDGTRSGNNPTMYPDARYYSPEFLKSSKPSTRVVSQFSGGNQNAQYYLSAGWEQTGTLLNMGEGANDKDQRVNVRSNVDFRITDFIKSNVNIVAIWDISRRANGNFWDDAATLRPNLYPPLIDTALVTDETYVPTARLINGRYMVGGRTGYLNNIYANLNQSGYYTQTNTSVQFNNGVDVDLNRFIKGLSFKTFIGFDFYNQYRETQSNTYAVYEPSWTLDPGNEDLLSLDKIGEDVVPGTKELGNTALIRNLAFYGSLNYSRRFGEKHAFDATAVAYGEYYTQTGVLQPDKKSHLGLRLNYAYNNRYIVDFSSALVSSAKLHSSSRVGFSPSLALGWIMSEENFLKGSSFVDFLKLNASSGMLKTDMTIPGYYLYEGTYEEDDGFSWNDGNRSLSSNVVKTEKNYGLTYQIRKEISAGAEALLFDRSIRVDANVFQELNTNLVTQPLNRYPDFLGGIFPYENYGEEKTSGVEIGASWLKSINNKVSIELGATMVSLKTKVLKEDERFEFDYLYRTGKPMSAMFGLEAVGLFKDDADIAGHAQQTFGPVRPGDIKYKDQNGDGVINENDEVMIGQSDPKFYGGFHFRVKYQNLTLFALATLREGSQRYFNNDYYWVSGDDKYSEVVLNRWTPATAATATYPRLTSQSSSNNFRSSTFWLYDNSLLALDRLQVNYALPRPVASKVGMKNLELYVRGSNLVRWSKNPEKMDLNVGAEPQYRYYAVGLKASL